MVNYCISPIKVGTLLLCYLATFSLVTAQNVNLTELFRKQVAQTCQKSFIYEKRVTDLSSTNSNTETQNISVATQTQEILEKEVEYAILLDANDAKLKGEYVFITQKDTTIAKLKQDNKELKFQKWCLSVDKGKITYLESFIHKSYWLYEFSVRIKVFFDENGLYKSHTLHSVVSIPYIGNYFNSKIEGKKK